MTDNARAELNKIRREIDESRGLTRKYIRNIEKKQNGWLLITKLLLKLRLDTSITKFLYKFLNIGSKIEAYVALHNVSQDDKVKKICRAKVQKLKMEYSLLAPMYISVNKAIGQFDKFRTFMESAISIYKGDLGEMRKVSDHDNIIIQKATRIALSIDFSRIMLLDCIDNLLRPAVTSGPTSVQSDQISSDDVKGGSSIWSTLIGGLSALTVGLLNMRNQEESEEKGEEIIEELEQEVEMEEATGMAHMYSRGMTSPDLEVKENPEDAMDKPIDPKDPDSRIPQEVKEKVKKESESEPAHIPKKISPELDPAIVNNRVERLTELDEMGVYDSMVDKVNQDKSVSRDEVKIIKELPKLLKKDKDKAMKYLSRPNSILPNILNGIDIDSPRPINKQLADSRRSKETKVSNPDLHKKLHGDFKSECPDDKDFTKSKITKFLREKRVVTKDRVNYYADKIYQLGSSYVYDPKSNQMGQPRSNGYSNTSVSEATHTSNVTASPNQSQSTGGRYNSDSSSGVPDEGKKDANGVPIQSPVSKESDMMKKSISKGVTPPTVAQTLKESNPNNKFTGTSYSSSSPLMSNVPKPQIPKIVGKMNPNLSSNEKGDPDEPENKGVNGMKSEVSQTKESPKVINRYNQLKSYRSKYVR